MLQPPRGVGEVPPFPSETTFIVGMGEECMRISYIWNCKDKYRSNISTDDKTYVLSSDFYILGKN